MIQSRVRFFLRACSRHRDASGFFFKDKHWCVFWLLFLIQGMSYLLTNTSNLYQVGGCAIHQLISSSILLCGYFSPVWFRDRLFRRVLFEGFEVSFLFEAFAVSFSTLLHYNYCRVSRLLSYHCVSLFHLPSCLLYVFLWIFFASLV